MCAPRRCEAQPTRLPPPTAWPRRTCVAAHTTKPTLANHGRPPPPPQPPPPPAAPDARSDGFLGPRRPTTARTGRPAHFMPRQDTASLNQWRELKQKNSGEPRHCPKRTGPPTSPQLENTAASRQARGSPHLAAADNTTAAATPERTEPQPATLLQLAQTAASSQARGSPRLTLS